MILTEKKMNLFEVDDKYYLAHCIDKTASMGISPINGRKYPKMMAYQINERYKNKELVQSILSKSNEFPTCVFTNPVFHLVTKERHYYKPTYESLTRSLEIMRDMIKQLNKEGNSIKYLAMPEIGCHADKLEWDKVREIIQEVFEDVDIEILVCSL